MASGPPCQWTGVWTGTSLVPEGLTRTVTRINTVSLTSWACPRLPEGSEFMQNPHSTCGRRNNPRAGPSQSPGPFPHCPYRAMALLIAQVSVAAASGPGASPSPAGWISTMQGRKHCAGGGVWLGYVWREIPQTLNCWPLVFPVV